MNVADQVRRAAHLYADRAAAICGDERRSYGELDRRSDRLAGALLARGLVKGDRVATLLENSVRCVEVDFALAKAGLVRASLNPRVTAGEAAYILADSDAKALIHGAGFDPLVAEVAPSALRIRVAEEGAPAGAIDYESLLDAAAAPPPVVAIDPEDLYSLFYTSGTTGRPKGVMLSHRAILHIASNMLIEHGPARSGEKILLMQPMTHGAGFYVLPWLMTGGCAVIMRHFDPAEVLRLARDLEIETIKLIPTMLQRVLRVPGAFPVGLPKLRQIIYGASPMPTEPLKDAIAKFGPCFVQIYGQSEAPMTLSVLPALDHDPASPHPERLASAGRPWATVDIRVVDDRGREQPRGEPGEVVLRAPHLMSGYWKRPDLTAATVRDGWLHTRDLGRMDAHGYLYLLGRTDEMIISGGYNIAPREVEEALYRHPAVQEAAVVGEPDPEWGQAVVAYVARRDGGRGGDDLIGFVKPLLGYKRPKRVYVVAALPKNANGKIQKLALTPALAMDGG